MRSIHPDAGTADIKIGARLRATRRAQGLTLEQLAGATGLTKGFLSRLERDDTLPSVPTLVHICQALSLPIGALFAEPDVHVIRRSEAPRINMGGIGADERLITPRGEEHVQILRSSLEPGANGGDRLYTVNCTVESVHVIAGEIEVTFPDHRITLGVDDTLTFPGRTPHTWQAGSGGAELLWVLVPAAWSGSA